MCMIHPLVEGIMVAILYKAVIRIAALICAYSLIINLLDLELPFRGSLSIDVVALAIWGVSEYQWKKEKGE